MLPLAIVLSLAIGVTGGMYFEPNLFMKWNTPEEVEEEKLTLNNDSLEEMEKIVQAYELINRYYIDEVAESDLVSGAIQGMIGTLKDPYSVYMDKKTAEQFNESLDSSFEGIGTEIGVEEEKVIIVSPYKDSPAEKAGLKPKDEIVSVNGKSVQGLNVQEVSVLIRGEKGTRVRLEIKRPGVTRHLSFHIKRDTIPIETVFSDIKEQNGEKVGYIEISSFSKNTAADFNSHLKKLEKENIKALVIDVRSNPGGLLTAVSKIVNELVPSEKPYMMIENKYGEKSESYTKLAKKKPYNIAVLIDEGSASASEILAAALQEAGGYPLIGEKTFGKGTVQQAVPMDDGSNIKLTFYKWLTPNGNWIHQKGIKPTLAISQPPVFTTHALSIDQTLEKDMTDEQIEHAQEILRSLGYEPGRIDGYYDLKTEIAVKAFQSAAGLPATGKIDVKTAAAMEKEIEEEKKDENNDIQLRTAIRYLLKD